MAAGTTIQHKRKAGAFAGGQLAAGELGVDTTNCRLYGSSDGSTVFLVNGNILQTVVQLHNPSAAQTLTTTHADVAGSDYAFTPVSASSNIVYRYSFAWSGDGGAPIISLKLLVDGTLETESETSLAGNATAAYSGGFCNYEYLIQSWGTSAKTIKMQAREHSASYNSKLHEGHYWDGAVYNKLRRAVLTITEYA